uniref:AB hydrolase-1 domain-containing protein n=2 Tax=Opuntia streptacantha TaxID=393608 RepID=A0A7C8YAU6_OPUST
MAEEMAAVAADVVAVETTSPSGQKRWTWHSLLRWIPSSTDRIIDSEKRLLSLVKTPYKSEQISIGTGPPGSKIRWFRSSSNKPRFINTVTFDCKEDAPTIVLVHGYGASLGFFFRNFDALAKHFRVIAIDQLG